MNFLLGNRLAFGTTAEINNLPVDLTPFLGREQKLSRIRDLFDTQARLITLKGISGTGCRRLAIRAAGQNESVFTSGKCLVDCAAGMEPTPVRLAAELSLPSGKDPEAGIESFLADALMLLVFVNASPGTEVVPFISSLLKNCSGITVPATSRNALEIDDEVVVPVGGISTARHSEGVPSDTAAVFIQAAERLAGAWFSGNLDLDAVEDICTLVDGVPMALNEVAGVEASQGSYSEAEQHYLASAEYYRRIGSTRGQAGIKLNLAIVNQIRGRGEEVRKNYSEALELGEKFHDENIIANSLCGLAFNSVELEKTVQAGSFLERAAGIVSCSGNKPVLLERCTVWQFLTALAATRSGCVIGSALLHNKAVDSEAEVFCMEHISTLRKDLGEKRIGELKQDAGTITLD
jgi:hypothetical protein